jgi:serine/threonine-protein kinase
VAVDILRLGRPIAQPGKDVAALLGALADDVDRYLAGEAVRAHPPAPWYRARKFIGRHRLGLAAVVIFLSLMVASTAIVAWQASKTQREARRANVIRDFLEDMFTPIRNGMINEKQASVRDMLAVATDKLGKDATLGDEARIDLQLLFSRLHGQLNDFDQAQALIGQAQALATSSLAEDDPLRLDAEISYAGNLLESGNAKQAEPLLQALESRIEGRRILHGAPLVRLYDNLAEASDMQGKHDDSAVLHERKALAERIGTFGPESPKVAAGYSNLATSFSATSGHVD